MRTHPLVEKCASTKFRMPIPFVYSYYPYKNLHGTFNRFRKLFLKKDSVLQIFTKKYNYYFDPKPQLSRLTTSNTNFLNFIDFDPLL